MRTASVLAALCISLLSLSVVSALDNGVGLTPPMGFISWERFRCNVDCVNYPNDCISESLYMTIADSMVSGGFRDVGYTYVNIDDCWSSYERSPSGDLVANATRFPSGMAALGEYLHARGMKFGIYNDIGTKTCGGFPGSLDYITQDATQFAAWGVDSLKLDGCYISTEDMSWAYPAMTKALNLTGRPILYACSWPAYMTNNPNVTVPWEAIAENCNYWRAWNDVQDSWSSVLSIINWWSANQAVLVPLAAPGQWNDPDMILCGDYSLSLDECQVQMALWAMFAAPLYLSSDLRSIRQEYADILKNKEVIAVDQDPLGHAALKLLPQSSATSWVYARTLQNGDVAVATTNVADNTGGPIPIRVDLTAALAQLRGAQSDATAASTRLSCRDIIAGQDLGVITNSITLMTNPHGVRMIRCSNA